MQAMTQPQQAQHIELDALRHTSIRKWSFHAISGARQQNVFSVLPLVQYFGRGPSAQPPSEGLHAMQSERHPSSGYQSERRDHERDSCVRCRRD